MKKLLVGLLLGSSLSSFAADLTINASAQGGDNCGRVVKLFADLVIGKSNKSIKITKQKPVSGSCDGVSCNSDEQDFKVTFNDDHQTLRTINISTVGPDSADRCYITRH